jgi:RNA polymerase sigma-70 factor (ECF subfamily)
VPANPTAWLLVTARHRAIDRIRRERTLTGKLQEMRIAEAAVDELDETLIADERL